MSTFDGIVVEFPDIRIDFFRPSVQGGRPPLAYFLSHVHSDHLTGLEFCKSPMIYCSAATKEILLRLEKFPHRMNFAKGILETRKQHYRHLKKLLKPIPLETPTKLELAPGRSIRVTLFDANHCVGAVMFLIEDEGNAILYTGDIRSEAWWVNALTRHPVLLPYVVSPNRSPIRRLDNIYLDTTFANKADPYRDFPTKADGTTELLEKVSKYPPHTVFYFDSWTFGYEDVWQALSTFLHSQIHVDEYRMKLYKALYYGTEPKAPENAKMIGFDCGNHFAPGYLTSKQAQIHSCEQGTGCPVFTEDFVRITPIISRHNGADMAELGAGGGQGDLDQQHELEIWDPALLGQLITLCASEMHSHPDFKDIMAFLMSAMRGQRQILKLDASLFASDDARGIEDDPNRTDESEEKLPIEKILPALASLVAKSKDQKDGRETGQLLKPKIQPKRRADGLPQQIRFPYSRHASYNELCYLVEAFKPKHIHPCTVDSVNWTPASSMQFLFGHLYNEQTGFPHDQKMMQKYHEKAAQSGPSRSVSVDSDESDEGSSRQLRKRPKLSSNQATAHRSAVAKPPDMAPDGLHRDAVVQPGAATQSTNHAVELKDGTYDHQSSIAEEYWSAEQPTANKELYPSSAPTEQHAEGEKIHASSPITYPAVGLNGQASGLGVDDDVVTESDKTVEPAQMRPPSSTASRSCRVQHGGPDKKETNPPELATHFTPKQRSSLGPESRSRPQPTIEHTGASVTGRTTTRPPNVDGTASSAQSLGSNAPEIDYERLAARERAHAAALSKDGMTWADVRLVSVHGHQVEDEL